jgi:hypothetical protein
MGEVDAALRLVSEEAAPPELFMIDDGVLLRVQGHSFDKESVHLRVGAVAFALLMGIAGGMLPDAPAKAGPNVVGLSEGVNLAPSTLLIGEP